jgi:hypothetical protein
VDGAAQHPIAAHRDHDANQDTDPRINPNGTCQPYSKTSEDNTYG